MSLKRSAGVIGVTCMLLGFAAGAEDPAPRDTEAPADIEPAVNTAAVAGSRGAIDSLELDSTSIRGNQELPKVLSIVPWKDPALGDLVGRPVNSLVDEVLAPIDREVFQRQTRYFDQLYADPRHGSAE